MGWLNSMERQTRFLQIMEHCRGGDLFKQLMMKGGTLDEAWVCTEVCHPCIAVVLDEPVASSKMYPALSSGGALAVGIPHRMYT